jgi:hypothetical protein
MRKISSLTVLCVFLTEVALCSVAPHSKQDDVTYLGFLDDHREEMVNRKPGVASQRVIRPAFEKTTSGWHRVDPSSIPGRMNWTIAFDGRKLGKVDSQAWPDEDLHLTALQTILTPTAEVPTVGLPSDEFAGIIGMGGDTKVRRPLIVVSKPYFLDPDVWKRTKLPDETVTLVRKAFRREYPHVNRCKDEQMAERNWKFPDSAVALTTVYGSDKHSYLVEATLNAGDCGWVDEPDDPLSAPWFFVSADGAARHIGSFMSLLDAGDYDNDGKSELVFFLSQGEDLDGFVLFDANLQRQATLTWSYH